MAKKLKIWNGASWEDVTFAITPPTTNVTNEFTTNQVIDTSTSVAALRITQRGTGEALRVEDETNPDSSPFIINSGGNVGIGTSSATDSLTVSRSTESVIGIYNTGSGSSWLKFSPSSTGAAYIHNTSNTAIVFTTNSTEKMRIDAAGQLSLGSITPNAFNKGIYINAESGQYAGIQLTNTANGTTGSDGTLMFISNTNFILDNKEADLYFRIAGNDRMKIATDSSVTIYGPLYPQSNLVTKINTGGTVYNSNDSGGISVRGDGTNGCVISFHRPNVYAVNMGLDTDNQFKIGGWSGGSTDHFVLNFGTGLTVSAARANTAQSVSDGRFRNIYTSTSSPSGGNDGDMWAVYV